MLVCAGHLYIIAKVEIFNLDMLTPALDHLYGQGNAQWELVGSMIHIIAETDLTGLREKIAELGLTFTWEQFVSRELD
jgi:hypothetical protein